MDILLHALAAPNFLRKRNFPRCGAASFPAIRPKRGNYKTADSQVADFPDLG
ncbi:hypothetical protein AB9K35_14555 [Leisingera sp. XS_AS12]